MSLSSTTNRKTYLGDGSSATFSFPYEFFNQSDLIVYLYDSLTGSTALQVLNTNYTISGTVANGIYQGGGNVVMASAIVSTTYIAITRDPSEVQNFVLQQNGVISSLALTQQLDYLTLLIQRQQDENSRSVKMPDGFGGTFDPTLPMGLGLAYNQILAINSGAVGFQFVNSSGLGSFGPAGYVWTGNGSSAVGTYQPINLSSSAFSGILSVLNGGTGNTTATQWGIVFASTASQLATSAPGASGLALVANASSAPSFQQLALSSAVTGTLPLANGGTGISGTSALNVFDNLSPLTTAGDLLSYGSGHNTRIGTSATDLGRPLVSGGGASPNSYSVLSVPAGGTNINSNVVQYGVFYASSATAFSQIQPGAAGTILTSNGASAVPTFQSPAALTTTSKTATYAAVASDNVIFVSSSAFTVSLPNAVGNTGVILRIIKTDSPIANVTISGTSSQTIGGFSFVNVSTQNEAWNVVSDGANWQVDHHYVPGTWTSYSPAITGLGTCTSVVFSYKRHLDSISIRGSFTDGTPTSATAAIPYPTGVVVNSNKLTGTMLVGRIETSVGTATYFGGNSVLATANSDMNIGKESSSTGPNVVQTGIGVHSGFINVSMLLTAHDIPVVGWFG